MIDKQSLPIRELLEMQYPSLKITIWAASCEKGPDDIFCPFLVLSFFAHFTLQIT